MGYLGPNLNGLRAYSGPIFLPLVFINFLFLLGVTFRVFFLIFFLKKIIKLVANKNPFSKWLFKNTKNEFRLFSGNCIIFFLFLILLFYLILFYFILFYLI